MLESVPAVKVILYLSDGDRRHGVPLYTTLLDFLFKQGVAGATVLKGVAGFGHHHQMHASHLLEISDHLPLRIEFIGSQEKLDTLLGPLEELVGGCLIELQQTTILRPVAAPVPIPAAADGKPEDDVAIEQLP